MAITMKQLEEHNDIWVIRVLLHEKLNKMFNPYVPLAERIQSIVRKLDNHESEIIEMFNKKEEESDLEVEILQHTIAIDWTETDKEKPGKITEADEEHISDMIKEGYNQGEINSYQEDEVEYRGWWKIKK